MRISEFFHELGSPVAYHARLTAITGGALPTIFLCQFLYWTGKQRDPDGWIYKTQAEIQNETGLTRKEQESARKQLKRLGLLEERFTGLPRRLEFRPNVDALNEQWEAYLESGESRAKAEKKELADRKLQSFQSATTAETPANSILPRMDIIECPEWTDKNAQDGHAINTEITSRDYGSENTSKTSYVKRFSDEETHGTIADSEEAFPNEETNPSSVNDRHEKSTQVGELDRDYRTHGSAPRFKKLKNQKLDDLVSDADGYLQMPTAKKFKLARGIATRRLQGILALQVLPDAAEPAPDKTGDDVQRNASGKLGIHALHTDEWLWEDEAFAADQNLSLRALRNYAVAQDHLSIEEFNCLVEKVFRSSVDWCKAHKQDAVQILQKTSVLDVFAKEDAVIPINHPGYLR